MWFEQRIVSVRCADIPTMPFVDQSDGYILHTARANASNSFQSVNSTYIIDSVGPFVIHMIIR
jgi:hypothetical protein